VILVESMAQCGGVGTRMLGLGGPGTYLFANSRKRDSEGLSSRERPSR
jgi:hypothetical protein